jgi:hypothetical protein
MHLFEVPFTGPVLPATVAVAIALIWSLLTTLGAATSSGWFGSSSTGHIDTDLGLDGPTEFEWNVGSTASAGVQEVTRHWFIGNSVAALRWLNLGGVPLVIWGTVFCIAWWFVSGFLWIGIDRSLFKPNLLWSSLLAVKNLILAALLTKLITKPLKQSLTPDRITTRSLIGRECVISSTEATPDFGLVKFKTGGAPLLLNVRTDGPRLTRGTPVWIVHYDPVRRVYLVSPTSTQQVDPDAEKLKRDSAQADI